MGHENVRWGAWWGRAIGARTICRPMRLSPEARRARGPRARVRSPSTLPQRLSSRRDAARTLHVWRCRPARFEYNPRPWAAAPCARRMRHSRGIGALVGGRGTLGAPRQSFRGIPWRKAHRQRVGKREATMRWSADFLLAALRRRRNGSGMGLWHFMLYPDTRDPDGHLRVMTRKPVLPTFLKESLTETVMERRIASNPEERRSAYQRARSEGRVEGQRSILLTLAERFFPERLDALRKIEDIDQLESEVANALDESNKRDSSQVRGASRRGFAAWRSIIPSIA